MSIPRPQTMLLMVALRVAALAGVVGHSDESALLQTKSVVLQHTDQQAQFVFRDGNIYSLRGHVWKSLKHTRPDRDRFVPLHCKRQQQSMKRDRGIEEPEYSQYGIYGRGIEGTEIPQVGIYGMFYYHQCCDSISATNLGFAGEFNFENLMQKWSNKRVLFFGDSLTQEMIDALWLTAEARGLKLRRYPRSKNFWRVFTILPYNITIHRTSGGNGMISPLPDGEHIVGTRPSSTKQFEDALQDSDIAYVNVGLHLKEKQRSRAESEFQYIRETLEVHMQRHPGSQHFIRDTFPQHFPGARGHGGPFEENVNANNSKWPCVGQGVDTRHHPTVNLAHAAFVGSPVKVLDYHEFLKTRGDLHSQDCSHFCFNYDMWKGIWYLMAASL